MSPQHCSECGECGHNVRTCHVARMSLAARWAWHMERASYSDQAIMVRDMKLTPGARLSELAVRRFPS